MKKIKSIKTSERINQIHEELQVLYRYRSRSSYLRIDYERQSCTLIDHGRNRDIELVGQEPDHRENYEASKEGRADIADSDDQRVLVAIVGEFVVGAERYQTAPSRAQGEEDLHSGVTPHFRGH